MARTPPFLHLLVLLISGIYSTAGAQEDSWEKTQRESRPSLKILWNTESDSTTKQGPAEIKLGVIPKLSVNPIAGASIRWYQLIPNTSQYYKNANHPWEANAYQWVGFGKIDCARREVTPWRDQWEVRVAPTASGEHPLSVTDAGRFYHADVGSYWFEVEVLKDGALRRSPGLSDSTERGMSTAVFRLSIREDDTLVGWLTSFFNVPGLFGCIPWQSENYIGVDCADALVAAWSKWKKQPMKKDWNVQGIVSGWPKATEFELIDGAPDREIKWGTEIQRGDFIAVRYSTGKQYQHIGALYEDANKNGALDGSDLVIHCGPDALQIQPLDGGSFDGKIAVIRATERQLPFPTYSYT